MQAETSEQSVKKNIQKLQRAVVDGLEDVKAQDIQVFDTEHLSALFERVIIASGTSNRQTRALAASVRDAVRQAGFDKPRIEGEENGEWIIVDCGSAVVHIMQPAIRQYYTLEEIWGEKPVRMRVGGKAPAKAAAGVKKTAAKTAAKTGKATSGKAAGGKAATQTTAGKPAAKKVATAATATRKPATAKASTAKASTAKVTVAASKSASTAKTKAPAAKAATTKAATAKKTPAKAAEKKTPAARKPAAKTARASKTSG